MKALAPVHVRALLRLCDRFGEPAFLDAGRRLQDARRFDAGAVKRVLEPLMKLTARDILVGPEAGVVAEGATVRGMLELVKDVRRQKVLAVSGAGGTLRGIVDIGTLQLLSVDDLGWANAVDVMVPFACVQPGNDLADIRRVLAESGLPQVPAVENGVIAGYVGETELARAYAREITGEGSPPAA